MILEVFSNLNDSVILRFYESGKGGVLRQNMYVKRFKIPGGLSYGRNMECVQGHSAWRRRVEM